MSFDRSARRNPRRKQRGGDQAVMIITEGFGQIVEQGHHDQFVVLAGLESRSAGNAGTC
jgi:hypothetical protein